jgi:hypothetical protein
MRSAFDGKLLDTPIKNMFIYEHIPVDDIIAVRFKLM